jgi:hypothetical protein
MKPQEREVEPMKLHPILQLKPILRTRGDVISSDSLDRTMKLEWLPSMKTRFPIADGRLKPLSLFPSPQRHLRLYVNESEASNVHGRSVEIGSPRSGLSSDFQRW